MSKKIKTLVCVLSIAGFGMVQAAPATAPAKQPANQGYQKQGSISFQMTVKAIDTQQRLLTLVDKSGDELVVHAGPKVKYFSQAKVGDVLTTTFTDSIAFTPVATDNRETIVNDTLAKARPGYAPEMSYTSTKTTTVKVLSVSPKKDMVTIQNAQGNAEKIKVLQPDLQARLQNVKPGENIQITLTRIVDIKAPMHSKQKLPTDSRGSSGN